MLDKKTLLRNLSNELKILESQVEGRKLYNFKCYVINIFVKSGIAIDYAFPFILSGFIIFNGLKLTGMTPFYRSEIQKSKKVEKMITSSGIEKSKEFGTYTDYEEAFSYSTGWKINEDGLYERVETFYQLNDSIDLSNLDIFSITKEEVENLFEIMDIKKIQKNQLNEEDKFYFEDMFIVNRVEKSENKVFVYEAGNEMFAENIIYLFFTTVFGIAFMRGKKILFKNNVSSKLKEIETRYSVVAESNIEELSKILAIKRQNMTMLDENSKSISLK